MLLTNLNLAGKTISEVDSEIKISVAKAKISIDNFQVV